MPTPYFDLAPNRLRQQFSRVRRTTGLTLDGFGDATFTEQRTTGYRGFFQIADRPGQTVVIAGNEIQYEAIVYTGATALIGEDDVILFGSSTATTISTRYHVKGVRTVYDGLAMDHKELFVAQEVR